jgi:hypothetical protein
MMNRTLGSIERLPEVIVLKIPDMEESPKSEEGTDNERL